MICPQCPETTLQLSHRDGIEIDYCPKCRGVWLDRGELDKLIERANARESAERMNDNLREHDYRRDDYKYGKKRKSFLAELFD